MLDRARARDATWDGRFYTGVLTTGIYCLPSCPARDPKPENVRFFASTTEARDAGLRPCKRCRPDAFARDRDPDVDLVRSLVHQVRRDPGAVRSVAELCRRVDRGSSRLHELFRTHLHRSPGRFLSDCRIEAARRGLAESDDRVTDLAFSVGFESLSAFHDAFRRREHCAPGALRAFTRGAELELELPNDFRIDDTLAFVGRHAESPTEDVDSGGFRRALWLDDRPRVVRVEVQPGMARIEALPDVSPSTRLAALDAVRRLLGLVVDPSGFERALDSSDERARLVGDGRGLRIPQTPSVFEAVVWSLVGQQVTVQFAATLRERLVRAVGGAVEDLVAHPRPGDLRDLDVDALRDLQFSRSKAATLLELAAAVAAEDLDLEGLRDGTATDADRVLRSRRGIGPWSSAYVRMRGCAFLDCVPVGDTGLSTALQRHFGLDARPGPDEVRRLLEPFAPYRSLATTHLWRSLATLPGGMA